MFMFSCMLLEDFTRPRRDPSWGYPSLYIAQGLIMR